jgi:hypothetical protein
VPDVVLTADAFHEGAPAGRAGDTVPQDLADKHGWEYARPGTKKAQAAQEPDES